MPAIISDTADKNIQPIIGMVIVSKTPKPIDDINKPNILFFL